MAKKKNQGGLTAQHDKAMHRYLTNGFKKGEALMFAGYSESVARTNPECVFGLKKFKEELERRLKRLRTKYLYTEELVLEEIAKVAFANMIDYMTIDFETGDGLVDLKWTTPEQLAALGEYTVETYMQGRGDDAVEVKRARVKMHGKLQALDMLMKYHGAYKNILDGKGNGEDLVAILLSARKRTGEKDDGED